MKFNKYQILILAVTICIPYGLYAGILGIPGEDKADIGILIYDLAGDSVVVEQNASRVIIPASVTKSITTASALSLIGPDYRYTTTVELIGSRGDDIHVWDGDLIVRGVGDPTLESEYFSDYNGFCDSVARHLERMGIREIKGKITVEDPMTDCGPLNEWESADITLRYGAGVYGVNWRDNIFTLWPSTGRTEPHVPDLDLKKINSKKRSVTRTIGSEKIKVTGPNFKNKKWCLTTTTPYPSKVLGHELTQTLADNGITVLSQTVDLSYAMDTETVYIHYSPELRDIMRSLMHRSDNMYAEAVLRLLVPDKVRKECIAREIDLWKSRGIHTGNISVRDGSGLSRLNRMSPHFVGDILKWMATSEMSDEYVGLFPVAGESGTVRNFMKDTPLAGRLVLKTGSMKGIQCYAGYYLGEDGKPTHVVVVFANGFGCSRERLREDISNLLVGTLAPECNDFDNNINSNEE